MPPIIPEAGRSSDGACCPRQGGKTRNHCQPRQQKARKAHAFRRSRWLEPEVTRDAKPKHHRQSKNRWKHTQNKQKTRGGAGLHRLRDTNRSVGKHRCCRTRNAVNQKERCQAQTQQSKQVCRVHERSFRRISRRFLRIFFSNSSRSLTSCSPTASRNEENNNSRDGREPASHPATTLSARWRSHSSWENRAEYTKARSGIRRSRRPFL